VENEVLWLTLLLLLPGVALLILSTSVRYGQIHGEIHHLSQSGNDDSTKEVSSQLLRRSKLFRNALISFYICVGFLALASILGGIVSTFSMWAHIVVMIITCLGVFFMLIVTILLIQESILSLNIIKEHVNEIKR